MSLRGFRFPLACLAASYAVLGAVIVAGYHYFPGLLATHFGADDQPDGWMTRGGCVRFLVALGLGAPGIILLAAFLAARTSLRHFNWNGRTVEIPRDRAPEVSLFLRRMGLWYACLLVLFIAGAQTSVLISNVGTAPAHLNRYVFALVLLLFAVGNGLVATRILRYFFALSKDPPRPAAPGQLIG